MALLREDGPGVRWGVEAGTEAGVPMLVTFERFRAKVGVRPMEGFGERGGSGVGLCFFIGGG